MPTNNDTQISPGIGPLPGQYAALGGVIVDIVGLNGTRHTAQVSPADMPAYFRGPNYAFRSAEGMTGPNGWQAFVNRPVLSSDVLNQLGGGLLSANIRITLMNGNTARPNPVYLDMFGSGGNPWNNAGDILGLSGGLYHAPGDADYYWGYGLYWGFQDVHGNPVECGSADAVTTFQLDDSFQTVHIYSGFPGVTALWMPQYASLIPSDYPRPFPVTGWISVPSGQLDAFYQSLLAGQLTVGLYVPPPGGDTYFDLSQGIATPVADIPLFPPEIITFTATPTSVKGSGNVVLSWTTQGCTSVSIDHGAGTGLPANGSAAVTVSQATTFTITGTGPEGTAAGSVTVGWARYDIAITLAADEPVLSVPGTTTLRWAVQNADRVFLDGVQVAAAGTKTLTFTGESSQTPTVTAYQDPDIQTVTQSCTVALVPVPLQIQTGSPLPKAGTTKTAVFVQFAATGGFGAYHWSATGLPFGLSITTGGLLSGTLANSHTTLYSFQITVSCTGVVHSATGTFVLPFIESPLTITTLALSPARELEPYSFQLQALYGLGSKAWSLISGSLPPGLTLSGSGLISGTPETYGYWTFTPLVTSDTETDQRTFELEVKLGWFRIDLVHKIYYRVKNQDGTTATWPDGSQMTNDPFPPGARSVFADVAVGFSAGVNQIQMTDLRTRGGGLAPEHQSIPEAANFWDLGYLDGKPYPTGNTCVVQIPQSLLSRFTRDQLQARIQAVLPSSSLPVLRFYDEQGNESA